MKDWTLYDFDLYLMGRMPKVSMAEFEDALKKDNELMNKFLQHKETIGLLKRSFSRRKLKLQLHKIHNELFSDYSKIARLKTRRRNIFFFAGNIAAAASIAALVTFGILFLTNLLGFDNKDAYLELRNEVKDIYSEQEYIKKELRKSKQIPVLFTGTSFAVSSDGILATNYHVIRGLDSVWVSNYSDSLVRYTAAIIYRDEELDIALLRIIDPDFTGFGRLPYSIPVKGADMGEYVYTLGYSKQEIVFGEGSISSISGHNSDTTAYQVSIPVNPGNSGGPLFDANGNLLGMISGKNTHKDGVGFAIKSHYIYNALKVIADSDPENQPDLLFKNLITGKKRTDQLRTLQPLIFRVQITR